MKKQYSVTLLEWPDGLVAGGPRLMGRTEDAELVRSVRAWFAQQKRKELDRLEK